MQVNERQIHIIWHTTPPTPAQEQAWRWLWAQLLCPGDPVPKKEEPQDGDPGVATDATVTSGHNLWDEYDNNSTPCPLAP